MPYTKTFDFLIRSASISVGTILGASERRHSLTALICRMSGPMRILSSLFTDASEKSQSSLDRCFGRRKMTRDRAELNCRHDDVLLLTQTIEVLCGAKERFGSSGDDAGNSLNFVAEFCVSD